MQNIGYILYVLAAIDFISANFKFIWLDEIVSPELKSAPKSREKLSRLTNGPIWLLDTFQSGA